MVFEREAIWLHWESPRLIPYMWRKSRGGLSIGLLMKAGWRRHVQPPSLVRVVILGLAGTAVAAGGNSVVHSTKAVGGRLG